MIYIDQKFKYPFKGKTRIFCHMISDNGTIELIEFGNKIGLKESWLQKRHTPEEHYDLFGSKIELALKNGAIELSNKEFFKIIFNKMEQSSENKM